MKPDSTQRFVNIKSKVLPEPCGPIGRRWSPVSCSPQPDTSRSCKTTDTGLVHRVCMPVYPQLSLLIINRPWKIARWVGITQQLRARCKHNLAITNLAPYHTATAHYTEHTGHIQIHTLKIRWKKLPFLKGEGVVEIGRNVFLFVVGFLWLGLRRTAASQLWQTRSSTVADTRLLTVADTLLLRHWQRQTHWVEWAINCESGSYQWVSE